MLGKGAMRRRFCLILLLLMAALPVRAAEPVVMGMGEFPPYVIYGDGPPTGLAVELASQVFPEAGLNMALRQMPFARAIQETITGGIDGVLIASHTPDRDGTIAFSAIAFCEYRHLYVRGGDAFDWRLTIANKTIGVGQGLNYGPMVQSWINARLITPVALANVAQLLEVLARGRFDAALVSRSEAELLMASRPELAAAVQRLDPHITVSPLRFAFSRAHDGERRARRVTQVLEKRGLVLRCAE